MGRQGCGFPGSLESNRRRECSAVDRTAGPDFIDEPSFCVVLLVDHRRRSSPTNTAGSVLTGGWCPKRLVATSGRVVRAPLASGIAPLVLSAAVLEFHGHPVPLVEVEVLEVVVGSTLVP